MNLVIDQANIISFLSDSNTVGRDECSRLIKRGINLIFNFEKSAVNPSTPEGQKFMMWLSGLTQGITTNLPVWVPKVDTSSIKSNFATNLLPEEKRDVYLLENKEVVDKIKEKGAILIGSVGEEIPVLTSLILENTERPAIKIESWDTYIPHLPVTDIIICDNHYFKDKFVYNANEHDLLKALCHLPTQSPVHCVIITKKGEIDRELKLEEEIIKLKKLIKEATQSKKSSITIMLTYRTHDRNAVTNYFRLKCGSCYHLKNNNIKSDVTAEIKTHANLTNEQISLHLISQYQEIISDNNNDIIGDKKSNFLRFPD